MALTGVWNSRSDPISKTSTRGVEQQAPLFLTPNQSYEHLLKKDRFQSLVTTVSTESQNSEWYFSTASGGNLTGTGKYQHTCIFLTKLPRIEIAAARTTYFFVDTTQYCSSSPLSLSSEGHCSRLLPRQLPAWIVVRLIMASGEMIDITTKLSYLDRRGPQCTSGCFGGSFL